MENATELGTKVRAFLADSEVLHHGTSLIWVGIATVVLLLWRLVSPSLDPREPPLLKPKIPIIGHLVGLVGEQTHFFKRLYQESRMPICTLPVLGGKMYVINSPLLVQQGLKSRTLSFAPFVLEFAQRQLNLKNSTVRKMRLYDDTLGETFHSYSLNSIHTGLMGKETLHDLTLSVLRWEAERLNAMVGRDEGASCEIDNLWLFLREFMTKATAAAFFGTDNPFNDDPELIRQFNIYDETISSLAILPMSWLLYPRAHKARAYLQRSMAQYYADKKYEAADTSSLFKARGRAHDHRFTPDETGKMESILLHVATQNAIPTLFWTLIHVFNKPDWVARLRAELDPLLEELEPSSSDEKGEKGENKKRRLRLSISRMEQASPFLVACYNEAMRLGNQLINMRRVLEDTVLVDSRTGHEYLLKKGVDVHMPTGIVHRLPEVWAGPGEAAAPGGETDSYNPERFVKVNAAAPGDESVRVKRAAFVPFGGGKHLCPGRKFAFAENASFLGAIVLGFDVEAPEGPGGKIAVPPMVRVKLGEGVGRPQWGPKVVIKRRKGWENVEWSFTT